jgi:hypothetical protein
MLILLRIQIIYDQLALLLVGSPVGDRAQAPNRHDATREGCCCCTLPDQEVCSRMVPACLLFSLFSYMPSDFLTLFLFHGPLDHARLSRLVRTSEIICMDNKQSNQSPTFWSVDADKI